MSGFPLQWDTVHSPWDWSTNGSAVRVLSRSAGLRQAFINITGNFHPGQQKVHLSMWDWAPFEKLGSLEAHLRQSIRRTADWAGGERLLLSTSKLCVVGLLVWYLNSNSGWDRSSALPTPIHLVSGCCSLSLEAPHGSVHLRGTSLLCQ